MSLLFQITPGMEEGGQGQDADDTDVKAAKDSLRDSWKKLVESEERLSFFKRMVGRGLEVRDIEHLGEDINSKFKSESMKGGKSEKVIIEAIMDLKLKDERRYQRETKSKREDERKKSGERRFKQIISHLNGEAKRWRKREKSKFVSKIEHLKRIRREFF